MLLGAVPGHADDDPHSAVPVVARPKTAPVLAPSSDELWFQMKFHGQKIGHTRSRLETTELDGQAAVHIERWSVITVRRQSNVIRMEHTLDLWFTPDGVPLQYRLLRKEGEERRKSEGAKDGDRFVITQIVGSTPRQKQHPLQPGVYLSSSMEWLFLRDLKPGREVKGRVIDEIEGDILDFTLKIAKKPNPGQPDVFTVHERLGPIHSVSHVHRSKGLLRTELLGAGIVMERTSKKEAIRLEEHVDIFRAALFPVSAQLPRRDELAALSLIFTTERPQGIQIPAFERQSVQRVSAKEVHVSTTYASTPQTAATLPIKTQALQHYLSATDYENTSDLQLVSAAKRVVKDEKDAWIVAKRINAFVHKHLKEKTLAHTFASATEAYRDQAGDCTEHSVLFSTLAKIVGIPTKLVTGLVYVSGPNPSFGYHEWVEVWLGSGWHPMDPTFDQVTADLTHIKFAEGLSDPDGLRRAGLAAASLIGDVQLSVSDYRVHEHSEPN